MRIEDGKRINPAFMFAAMLWYPLCALADKLMDQHNLCHYDAIMEASNIILDDQVRTIAIPRRHTATIRDLAAAIAPSTTQWQTCVPPNGTQQI